MFIGIQITCEKSQADYSPHDNRWIWVINGRHVLILFVFFLHDPTTLTRLLFFRAMAVDHLNLMAICNNSHESSRAICVPRDVALTNLNMEKVVPLPDIMSPTTFVLTLPL